MSPQSLSRPRSLLLMRINPISRQIDKSHFEPGHLGVLLWPNEGGHQLISGGSGAASVLEALMLLQLRNLLVPMPLQQQHLAHQKLKVVMVIILNLLKPPLHSGATTRVWREHRLHPLQQTKRPIPILLLIITIILGPWQNPQLQQRQRSQRFRILQIWTPFLGIQQLKVNVLVQKSMVVWSCFAVVVGGVVPYWKLRVEVVIFFTAAKVFTID